MNNTFSAIEAIRKNMEFMNQFRSPLHGLENTLKQVTVNSDLLGVSYALSKNPALNLPRYKGDLQAAVEAAQNFANQIRGPLKQFQLMHQEALESFSRLQAVAKMPELNLQLRTLNTLSESIRKSFQFNELNTVLANYSEQYQTSVKAIINSIPLEHEEVSTSDQDESTERIWSAWILIKSLPQELMKTALGKYLVKLIETVLLTYILQNLLPNHQLNAIEKEVGLLRSEVDAMKQLQLEHNTSEIQNNERINAKQDSIINLLLEIQARSCVEIRISRCNVAIHASPLRNSASIGTIHPGNKVTVYDTQRKWILVSVEKPDGLIISGWVLKKCFEKE